VWSYMAFGTAYANILCLIHSEFSHPFDRLARMVFVGTAADHHVHHRKCVVLRWGWGGVGGALGAGWRVVSRAAWGWGGWGGWGG
jgi:hypothetical protein